MAPLAFAASAVTWDNIANQNQSGKDVLSYGLGLKAQRFSPLKNINTQTVSGLVPTSLHPCSS